MFEEEKIREKKAQEKGEETSASGTNMADKKTIEIDVGAMRVRDDNNRRSMDSAIRSQIPGQKEFATPIRPNTV